MFLYPAFSAVALLLLILWLLRREPAEANRLSQSRQLTTLKNEAELEWQGIHCGIALTLEMMQCSHEEVLNFVPKIHHPGDQVIYYSGVDERQLKAIWQQALQQAMWLDQYIDSGNIAMARELLQSLRRNIDHAYKYFYSCIAHQSQMEIVKGLQAD